VRLFLVNILLFIFIPLTFGQLTPGKIKSNFALNLIKYVEWENEDSIQQYSIGVLGDDEVLNEFKNRSGFGLIKNKSFKVVEFKKISEIGDVHAVYVDKRGAQALKRILEITTANNILMISDSCKNIEFTMINLLDPSMPGDQFEVNKENMTRANLQISSKLLYHGGSEEDLRKMYQTSEKELSNVQEELLKQTAIFDRQRKELETTRQEILGLNREINKQEEHLKSMITDIETKQDSLDRKQALLEEQKIKIQIQQKDIDEQNDQLQRQKFRIQEGSSFLNSQKKEIKVQEEKIIGQQKEIADQSKILGNQKIELQEQSQKIEKQRTILYFFIAIFILAAAMVFFILRAYRIKRQANEKLRIKNAAIAKQKEEIQSQQELLKVVNRKIEKQNENIRSSINYALTIQQALLPSEEEMTKAFDSFVLFRPKDIVSGDFYWMSKVVSEREANEKTFIAVADCTGHGVPGAFLSMIGIKLLNSIVNERKQHNPRIILEMLNIAVQKALKQEKNVNDDGMDICLCCLEKTTTDQVKVIFTGARRPLYYCHDEKLMILKGDRKTVGGRFFKNQVFKNHELLLDPGDRIYLSSDGMVDQNAPDRRKFGSRRLIQLLKDSMTLSMVKQKQLLEEALDAFQQSEKQRDDISLLAIKL
jgi:serine phosphatase RsbU (regulator of sigma subunit)